MSARMAIGREVAPALRLGFLGLGWIGRKRLDAIATLPEVHVAALVDSDAQRLESAQRHYGDALASDDVAALLDCDLDGVVIATPNGCHAQQAIACLSQGLPVFCQKPLATNAPDAARVVAAARMANRLLGVDFCYRHVRGMGELRRRIAAGQLGKIAAIDLTFHNAYGPDKRWCFDRSLAGGGCLLDLGIHLIDLALWLRDSQSMTLVSRDLFAQGRAIGADQLEDLAFAEFRQSDGAIVRLACSWHAHMGRDAVIELQILGSEGGAAWRNVNGSFYDFELQVYRGTSREQLGGFPDEWGGRALQAWVRRLAVDRSYDPQCFEFVRSAQLIDAVYGQ